MLQKIISGGQTGADRAALDFAIEFNIPHGGWIPKGRKTEDGVLPEKYQLQEMPTASYPKRTEKNILDSDGTLILSYGKLTGGSALTRKLTKKHSKPWVHVDLDRWGLLFRISPVRGFRSMAKGGKGNCNPRRTQRKGESFGRRSQIGRNDFFSRDSQNQQKKWCLGHVAV